jgi:GNAT superfamily N-acetyltransferase
LSEIVIHPLTPERAGDLFGFFDGAAFADHPEWRTCYCAFCHFDHAKGGWNLKNGDANRAASAANIANGTMRGHIAYVGDTAIGWVNAAPSANFPPGNQPQSGEDRSTIGNVLCFVVARDWRRQGVARALLDAACAGLKAQGMTIAEGNPRGTASSDAENHFGPLDLYLSAGFAEHALDETDGSTIVRKAL